MEQGEGEQALPQDGWAHRKDLRGYGPVPIEPAGLLGLPPGKEMVQGNGVSSFFGLVALEK
jgi:hypothetical protein